MPITIYRTDTAPLVRQKRLPELLQRLPPSLRPRALRYRSEQSVYNYVVGRLLLQRGLVAHSLDPDLERIEYQENGKPVLPGIHFSIAHSAQQVICGFSREGRLGVDLEKITPVDFDDFTAMFTAREWAAIKGAADPLRTFYWFWTRKESIIKALGEKLGFLHAIELDVGGEGFEVGGEGWFLGEVSLPGGYLGAVYSEIVIERLAIVEIRF